MKLKQPVSDLSRLQFLDQFIQAARDDQRSPKLINNTLISSFTRTRDDFIDAVNQHKTHYTERHRLVVERRTTITLLERLGRAFLQNLKAKVRRGELPEPILNQFLIPYQKPLKPNDWIPLVDGMIQANTVPEGESPPILEPSTQQLTTALDAARTINEALNTTKLSLQSQQKEVQRMRTVISKQHRVGWLALEQGLDGLTGEANREIKRRFGYRYLSPKPEAEPTTDDGTTPEDEPTTEDEPTNQDGSGGDQTEDINNP